MYKNIIKKTILVIVMFLFLSGGGLWAQNETDDQVVVRFNNQFVEEYIRYTIDKQEGDILVADVKEIESLKLNNFGLGDISFLRYFEGLAYLDLSNNQPTYVGEIVGPRNKITDLEPLSALVNLKELNLSGNNLSDIRDLESFVNLTKLNLNNNHLSDISALESLVNLTELKLSYTLISNINSLNNLTKLSSLELRRNGELTDISSLENANLTYIDLKYCKVEDISSLKNHTNLKELNLSYNRVTDISTLKNLTNLTKLELSDNQINDITALTNLTNLENLNLGYNKISDIVPLTDLINLKNLNLQNNASISDITPLKNLAELTILNLNYEHVTDITPLGNLVNLMDLRLCDNEISDISSLRNLTNLAYINLNNNKVSDIIPLENLTSLRQLFLYANRVRDISVLSKLKGLERLDLRNNPLNNSETPYAVHKPKLDFIVSNNGQGTKYEVWVVEEPVLYGDLNGDGTVNSLDYILLQRYVLEIISEFPIKDGFVAADLNGDGKINSTDIVLMKRYILEIIDRFPAEYEEKTIDNFIEGNSTFAFNIFSKLVEDDKNVFISPINISMALSMVYQGSSSVTRDEMSKVLGYEGIDIEDINEYYKSLFSYLNQCDDKIQLTTANSIWLNSMLDDTIKKDFISVNQDVFDAFVTSRDFSDKGVIDEMNSWISDATEGKIDRMLNDINPDILSYIISSIYFKGQWTNVFNANNTFVGTFTMEDGRTQDVLMMSKSGWTEFGEGDGFKAISLPYGNGKVSMYVILPDEETPIDDFIQGMDINKWYEIKNSVYERNLVRIRMPRFKIEYGVKGLKESLMDLGMEKAFSSLADFSDISNMGFFIDNVLHKSVIEVDEYGTEAAAVTVIIAPGSAMPMPNPPEFFADRPFMFIIADNEYDTILFMGKVDSIN
ncbi:UNVERIFIED_CONTAM: serine protease inhibitor/Leucine-rich repeat (LRR) protein [Acetivibrio alkalicellulosi]